MVRRQTRLERRIEMFMGSATGGWPAHGRLALHPNDQARLAGIIRWAHATHSAMSPERFRAILSQRGFNEQFTERVVEAYRWGRMVLAMRLYPWDRSGSKKQRFREWQWFEQMASDGVGEARSREREAEIRARIRARALHDAAINVSPDQIVDAERGV